jgi:hypothetical protein
MASRIAHDVELEPLERVATTRSTPQPSRTKRTLRKETMSITEGNAAPAFTPTDQTGKKVFLKDPRGKDVIVHFYSKDDTPKVHARKLAASVTSPPRSRRKVISVIRSTVWIGPETAALLTDEGHVEGARPSRGVAGLEAVDEDLGDLFHEAEVDRAVSDARVASGSSGERTSRIAKLLTAAPCAVAPIDHDLRRLRGLARQCA